jgi:hypothetical protein
MVDLSLSYLITEMYMSAVLFDSDQWKSGFYNVQGAAIK